MGKFNKRFVEAQNGIPSRTLSQILLNRCILTQVPLGASSSQRFRVDSTAKRRGLSV